MADDLGQEIEDRTYNQRDMDRVLVLNQRTRRVAGEGRRVPRGDRSLRENHRFLRGHRPCRTDALLLDKYADEGLAAVEDRGVLRVSPLSDLGTPLELVRHFGGRDGYDAALQELEAALFDTAA